MKTKSAALTFAILAAIVFIVGAILLTNRRQSEPPQTIGNGSPPALTVDALASKAGNHIGRPLALHGVVDRVSAEQGLIVLIDPSEANCTDACQRNIVIVSMPAGSDAPLPAMRSEVLAHGVVESADAPLRMAATRLVTGAADIRKALDRKGRR